MRLVIPLLLVVLASPVAAADEAKPAIEPAAEGRQFFAVRVADVDAAIDWYTQLFGLELLNDTTADTGAWRIANLANQRLFVEVIRDDRAAEAARPLGIAKVGFDVADVEAIAALVMELTGDEPRVVDDTRHGQRLLQLRDPEGNVIQLSSPL